MLFTKASEYALLSLILLSQSNSPKDVDTMSTELGISKSFLAKILQNLAKEGILNSFKGANGGFILANKPANISIKKILESAEKRKASVFECSNARSDCPSNKGDICKMWPMFNSLQLKVDDFLDNISLADIIKK
ncbi:Rrf2 family transcriptional regulator [Campylobacter fetus]|uniref:Transcriptional regulator, IscR/Rrf2 family n=4 Tax=Campylobacter fetus TaxID=196 RepID=A0AAE6MA55_CAMFE|nr:MULTISPECIES: Rrf2 family transcriptional regulator [Campylobacter]OCS21903.1 Rrf2 family transcriptional regulator [Campylobacter fetus subsp. venerealis cfvi97/532]OCS26249.1 Rrf2 family transcriptional regulator [Campylobacter fetus subsp. venerealis cfvB10]OCS29654.1 Rrf2 family transcriptional regulator [Campylobacter fetus subsp. venerealis LMG 6570 = CCUG 33900]OCS43109.1 Rrf2 family transcriptional regulator [Campylobacter fetus subsp. venerealis cfvi02/298]ABK83163.1 transcriptiona